MSNIICGTPGARPQMTLATVLAVMLVFSILVGLNVYPDFHGARLNSTNFGHYHITRGWPAPMIFESHRFTTEQIKWLQDDEGRPLQETTVELKRICFYANPVKGAFAYSGWSIAINTVVGLAILAATVFLSMRYARQNSPRVFNKTMPESPGLKTS